MEPNPPATVGVAQPIPHSVCSHGRTWCEHNPLNRARWVQVLATLFAQDLTRFNCFSFTGTASVELVGIHIDSNRSVPSNDVCILISQQ